MKHLKRLTVLLLCTLALGGCKEDEYVYPGVVTEFVDARTDATGTLTELITDRGNVLSVQPREGLDGLTPDSVYRTVSIYEPLEKPEQEVFLYSSRLIFSMQPLPADRFKQIKTDPVSIRSIWRSGNYINLILLPQVKDKAHAFHFADRGISQENGRRTLTLTLHHDRNGDEEAFASEVYLSVPLWGYKGTLEKGDRIVLQLNTYEEGTVTREFTY